MRTALCVMLVYVASALNRVTDGAMDTETARFAASLWAISLLLCAVQDVREIVKGRKP